jgi:hypothetical protein
MCNVAEQAAEAARACAASARIGKRVVDLGSGGWSVLCDCAQTVLRTCRASASSSMRVGHAAMTTPGFVTAALDDATERKLEKGGERAVRELMEAILTSVREGRDAASKAQECTEKAAEGASVVLSLVRLPPDPERLASAVGSVALVEMMSRVSDVLGEMATAVGEGAERAMRTAVSVERMHALAKGVEEISKEAAAKGDAASKGGGDSSSSSESDEEDEELREMKRKREEEERRRREEEAAKQKAEAGEDPEAHLGARAKARLAHTRALRKLSAEVRESQAKLHELLLAAPQLIPRVTVDHKEELFQNLSEVIAAAEQPIARRWYRRGGDGEGLGGAGGLPAGDAGELSEWVAFATAQLEFVFHAADVSALPAPMSLGTRMVREAFLVDASLAAAMLQKNLFSRVMLFAPDAAGGGAGLQPRASQLEELQKRLDRCIVSLDESVRARAEPA